MIEPITDNYKLTIGFVLDDGLNKPDGVQQNILTLGQWLKSEGHEVHYLVGETDYSDIENLHVMSNNLKVHFNGNVLSTPFPAKASRIDEVLGLTSFDVLHVQIPYSPFMAARILPRANAETAIVGTFHILPVGRIQHLLTRFLGMWLRRSLKLFDKFFSVSQPAALFAENTFRITSSILPNPVNISLFKPVKPMPHSEDLIRIVFVGRLVERKGCLQLLQALEYLGEQKLITRKIEVHICGTGPQRKKLEHFVTHKNLSNVQFHGFVPENKKIEYLQKADIAVFPSLGGESFGIVLIEAMAAESHVVLGGNNPGYASVLGSLPESLFNPEDVKEFAQILQKYIENSETRRELFTRQQQLVAKFDVLTVGEELIKSYTDCITKRKSR